MLEASTMRPRLNEHEIGQDVLDFFDLMSGEQDGAAAVEIIVEERIVELFAIEDVEAEGGFVEDEQARVNGHDQGEMKLSDHALGKLAHSGGALDAGSGEEGIGLGAIEAGMDGGDIVDGLRNAQPAREDGDVGNEADIAHQEVAMSPGIEAQDAQLSLVTGEAEDGVQGRALPCPVGADEAEDATWFDLQIDTIEGHGGAEGFA